MPIVHREGTPKWIRREPRDSFQNYLMWLVGLIVLMIAARYIHGETIWPFVYDAPAQAADFLSRMFPPDMGFFSRTIPSLWDTVNIAVFGTVGAAAISLPLAFLAAKNTTPHISLRAVALTVIVVSRSVNSLIWALLLVQVVGPGIFAGVLAIGIRSIGMISKLTYEAIEEVDREPIEAVTATGASRLQVFLYGYVPQLLPTFVGTAVYRWEINIRESTIIGVVGGGGIGFLLSSAINRLAWDQALVVLITIFATVVAAEWVSVRARAAYA